MRKMIEFQSDRLQAWESDQQYIIFNHITEDILARIDHKRENGHIGRHTQMTYYTDTNLLIIKLMPSEVHERAHRDLAGESLAKILSMAIPKREMFCEWQQEEMTMRMN